MKAPVNILRYPGGKQRMLTYLLHHLPSHAHITGKFVEPFAGSAAVFFALQPERSLLADKNRELIELYCGIQADPDAVWNIYQAFLPTKEAYYQIRSSNPEELDLVARAARTLYLNRTCFKGMWRHNGQGQFNVGYGGQDRRWVISQETLCEVANRLRSAELRVSDFESIIDECHEGDFLFLDPPYRPSERDLLSKHYAFGRFCYDEHQRLAHALRRASHRGVKWAMTTSSHPDIVSLFVSERRIPFPKGTGSRPGLLTSSSGEVLLCNYEGM